MLNQMCVTIAFSAAVYLYVLIVQLTVIRYSFLFSSLYECLCAALPPPPPEASVTAIIHNSFFLSFLPILINTRTKERERENKKESIVGVEFMTIYHTHKLLIHLS